MISSRSSRGVRAQRRLAGPPDRDRQVVDEQRRDERRQVPARLAARREVDQLGAGLGRVGAGQHAVGLDPRVQPGRPVRVGGQDDQRPRRGGARSAARSSRRVARPPRAGGRRRPGSSRWSAPRCAAAGPLAVAVAGHRLGCAQIRASSFSMSSIECAAATPAQRRLAGRGASAELDAPAARRPRADGDDLARRPVRSRRAGVRSAATVGPPGRAGRRPPPGPRCPPRSSGSPARARRPRRR